MNWAPFANAAGERRRLACGTLSDCVGELQPSERAELREMLAALAGEMPERMGNVLLALAALIQFEIDLDGEADQIEINTLEELFAKP